MALQAAELPEGPHVVTSGTASVDATPDIATLAIEVSVSSKDAAQAKKQAKIRSALLRRSSYACALPLDLAVPPLRTESRGTPVMA